MPLKCDQHSGCVTDIKNNKKNIETLFTAVDKIKNRPPIWVTAALSASLAVIGYLSSWVIMLVSAK